MTAEQERDRYIEAILGGRLQFHLHRVNGAGFALAWQYPYWRAVHRRWLALWYGMLETTLTTRVSPLREDDDAGSVWGTESKPKRRRLREAAHPAS